MLEVWFCRSRLPTLNGYAIVGFDPVHTPCWCRIVAYNNLRRSFLFDFQVPPATWMHRVAVVPQPFTLGLRLLRVGNAPAHLLLVVSCIALAGFLHTVLPISCKFVGSRKYPQTFGMVPSAKLAQTRRLTPMCPRTWKHFSHERSFATWQLYVLLH